MVSLPRNIRMLLNSSPAKWGFVTLIAAILYVYSYHTLSIIAAVYSLMFYIEFALEHTGAVSGNPQQKEEVEEAMEEAKAMMEGFQGQLGEEDN